MEHRILAIVVTDLQGFTEAAARADREDLEAFITRHHAEVGAVIREHGGRLVKTLGTVRSACSPRSPMPFRPPRPCGGNVT
jgi:class 3 adenylate cyclase